MDYQLNTETVTDPAQIQETLLRRAYEVWCKARTISQHEIPSRSDLDLPFSLTFALPHLVIFDVEKPKRYKFRLQGSELVRIMGSQNTGLYMDSAIPGPFHDILQVLNDAAVDKRDAEYSTFYAPWASVRKYARLIMPIKAEDSEDISQLLVVVELAYEGNEMIPYKVANLTTK